MAAPTQSATPPETTKFDFAVSLLGALLPGLYLLITSTTTLVTSIWPYDFKRMLEFALLLMLFLLPSLSRPLRGAFGALLLDVPRWVSLTLLGVFGWGVLSALVNARSPMHLANSLSEVVLLASLVLGVFVIAACRRVSTLTFDRLAVSLLALTGLAVGVQELMGVFAAHAGGVDFNFRVSLLHFSWPRFYNQVQSWTVPVVAALPLLFARYPLAKILCVAVLGFHWYVILMTGARGSFLALTSAMLFAVIFLPAVRGLLLKWQLAGAALGVLLYAGVLFSFQTTAQGPEPTVPLPKSERPSGFYGNEDEDTSGFLGQSVGRPLLDPMGRTGMWRQALRDARAHPLLGIGPMNYVCTSPAYIGHPHNFPLQLAAEWGIPVAITVSSLFAIFLVLGASQIRRRTSSDTCEGALGGLLLTGTLAAALHACVSGVMVMPASHVAGLLVAGTLIGIVGGHGPFEQRTALARYLRLSGILAVLGLLTLGANELRTMPERSVLMRPGEDLRPRIWQDAKVCRLYTDQNEVTN